MKVIIFLYERTIHILLKEVIVFLLNLLEGCICYLKFWGIFVKHVTSFGYLSFSCSVSLNRYSYTPMRVLPSQYFTFFSSISVKDGVYHGNLFTCDFSTLVKLLLDRVNSLEQVTI